MQDGSQDGRTTCGAAGWTQLFTQMMMMPFSAFVYGMDLLVQVMQGTQRMAAGATEGLTGRGTQPFGGAGGSTAGTGTQAAGGATAGSAVITPQTTREERSMSDQNWNSAGQQQGGGGWGASGQGGGGQGGWGAGGQGGWGGGGQSGGGQSGGDQGWGRRDECRDQDLCDVLRLVRFKILFLKRDYEVAFDEQEELVPEEMTKEGFISWKVAEFIQRLGRGEIAQPGKWREKNNYPANEAGGEVVDGKVRSLPDKDKRHLRVYVQVLDQYQRERKDYEKDKIRVLEEIRDKIGTRDQALEDIKKKMG